MIFKSTIVSLLVAAVSSSLLFHLILGLPQHFLRGMVAFFVVGLLNTVINNVLNNQVNSETTSTDEPGTGGQREEGQVKWFNISKGFGFITRAAGDDIFVHYRSIRGQGHRSLSEGQKVEYMVVDGDKGLQAEDVVALTAAKRRGRR